MAAAALAACAAVPAVWVKAGNDQAKVVADLADCRRLANDDTWRRSWELGWPPRFYDPTYMPPYYRAKRPFWLDFPVSFEREQALVEFCMHSRGYRLEAEPY